MIKSLLRRFAERRLAACSLSPSSINQRGFTLVELMVAIALGLLVLAALSALFVSTSANRREIDRAAGVLENGRYALSVLRSDFALAGYYGTLAAPVGTVDAACSNDIADWDDSLSFHVWGSNNGGSELSGCFASSSLAPRKAGSDAVVIQRASTCVSGPTVETGCEPRISSGSEAYIQVSECGAEYAGSAKPFTVYLGNSGTATTWNKRVVGGVTCTTDGSAPIRRFYKSLYYVDTSNNLVRADMVAAATASTPPAYTVTTLAEGIENIQFQYGFDTNNDGTADEFGQSPPGGYTWSDAMGVRVWVMARAPTATPGYSNDKQLVMDDYSVTPSDSFKRHVFSSYIGFVNASGRRFQ